MTRHYQRCSVLQYNDLSTEQKKEVLDLYFSELSDAHSTGYVICEEAALPLSMFIRLNYPGRKIGIWDAVYSTSAFSGFYLKISDDCSTILVADRHF